MRGPGEAICDAVCLSLYLLDSVIIRHNIAPNQRHAPNVYVGGSILASISTLLGSGPTFGGLAPEGSRKTLCPETIHSLLPAWNLEMLQVQPCFSASLAVISSRASNSSELSAIIYISLTFLINQSPSLEKNWLVVALKWSPELESS